MKIKLIHYPYYKHEVGDIVDLGEEINNSLVSLERAVFVEGNQKPTKKVEEDKKEVVKEEVVRVEEDKKFLENELQQDVQEAEKELETTPTEETPTDAPEEPVEDKSFLQNDLQEEVEQVKSNSPKQSFWDKIK